MQTITCPKCGKELTLSDPSRSFIFCEYCGAKIELKVSASVEDSSSQVERTHIHESDNRTFKDIVFAVCKSGTFQAICVLITIFLLFAGMYLFLDHMISTPDPDLHKIELDRLRQEEIAASRLALGQASVPHFTSFDDARSFAKKLRDSGFTNVTTEEIPDLVAGVITKEYQIEEVLVDGAPDYSSSTWYPVDTPIVVRYHVYREGAKEAKDELIDRATNKLKGKAEDTIDKVGDKINSFLDDSSSTK